MPFIVDASIVLAGSGVLLLIIGYFLRKVDVKVDNTSSSVNGLATEIKLFKAEIRSDIKEDMINVFNATCHERQVACATLQETKIKTGEARDSHICAKIAKLEAERKDDWRVQRSWNDKIEDKLNKR